MCAIFLPVQESLPDMACVYMRGTPPLCGWILVRPSRCGLYELHDVTATTRYASGGGGGTVEIVHI